MIPEPIKNVDFQEIDFLGRKMLCTSLRVKRDTIPKGLYAYDVRHTDDDWGAPCQLQEKVLVNHYGTIITDEPIQLEQDFGGVKFMDFDPEEFGFTDHETVYGEDVLKYFENPEDDEDEEDG